MTFGTQDRSFEIGSRSQVFLTLHKSYLIPRADSSLVQVDRFVLPLRPNFLKKSVIFISSFRRRSCPPKLEKKTSVPHNNLIFTKNQIDDDFREGTMRCKIVIVAFAFGELGGRGSSFKNSSFGVK
uniref:Ovule protein n=1 Tax=Steinernema glaseri TaxID=37863 RepID=A0A1I8ANU8_9BILA